MMVMLMRRNVTQSVAGGIFGVGYLSPQGFHRLSQGNWSGSFSAAAGNDCPVSVQAGDSHRLA
jgi:hypothetical protein